MTRSADNSFDGDGDGGGDGEGGGEIDGSFLSHDTHVGNVDNTPPEILKLIKFRLFIIHIF